MRLHGVMHLVCTNVYPVHIAKSWSKRGGYLSVPRRTIEDCIRSFNVAKNEIVEFWWVPRPVSSVEFCLRRKEIFQ